MAGLYACRTARPSPHLNECLSSRGTAPEAIPVGAPGPTRTGDLRFRKSPAANTHRTALDLTRANHGLYTLWLEGIRARPDAFAPAVRAQKGHSADEVGPPAPSATVCGVLGRPDCPSLPVAPGPRLGPRLAFYGALAVADLVTTEMSLHRGNREVNPLLRHRGARLALEAAAAFGSAKLDQLAARKGKRKALWIGRAALTIGTAWIVKRNLDAYVTAGRARR